MMQAGWPMSLAIPLTLLLGLLCGLLNAALIHYTGISPLVITLGTLYLYGGGALLLSGMAGATGYEGIGGFPDSFTAFANLTLFGLPIPLVLFAVITFFFWLLGGTGTLLGAFLGAFFLTQIDTVLVLFRLPAWWNDFIAGLVLLGVLVLDGRLRQALARHQRALKYSRFQPGNKGGKRVAPFPERKNKEVA